MTYIFSRDFDIGDYSNTNYRQRSCDDQFYDSELNNYSNAKEEMINIDTCEHHKNISDLNENKEYEELKINQNINNVECEHQNARKSRLLPIREENSVKQKSSKLSTIFSNDLTSDKMSTKIEFYNQFPVEDRTMIWEKNRKKKIEDIKNKTKNNDLDGCTFQPQLTSNHNDYIRGSSKIDGKVNISSIDKYLSRMYSARIEKENKKLKLINMVGSGKNWKKQITVPCPPKLTEKKKYREKEPFKTPLANRYNCCPNSDLAKYVQNNNDSTNFHVKNMKIIYLLKY